HNRIREHRLAHRGRFENRSVLDRFLRLGVSDAERPMPAHFAIPDEDDRQPRNEVFVEHVGGLLLEVADKSIERWLVPGQLIPLRRLALWPGPERAERKPERGRSAVTQEFSTAHASPKSIR